MKAIATRSGGTWKAVTCEHCNAQFAYYMTTTVTATQTATVFTPLPDASRAASADAERELGSALERRIGWVWCPACGHYPKALVPRLRWRATRFYYLLALLPLLAGLVYAGAVQRTAVSFGVLHNMEMNLVSFPFESGTIWFAVAAVVTGGVVFGLSLLHQPNASADARAGTMAHSDVLLREQYDSRRASGEGLPPLTW